MWSSNQVTYTPKSTIRAWSETFVDNPTVQHVGQRSLLKPNEDEDLQKYFTSQCQKSQSINREVMIAFAKTVLEKMYPSRPSIEAPHFTTDWSLLCWQPSKTLQGIATSIWKPQAMRSHHPEASKNQQQAPRRPLIYFAELPFPLDIPPPPSSGIGAT